MKSKYNLFIASVIAITMAQTASAAIGTWTGTFDGTWDTSNTNWSGVSADPWDTINGPDNTATFNTVGLAAVVIGPVDTNGITFSTTGALSGSAINMVGILPTIAVATGQTGTISSTVAGTAGLIKSDAGTLTLADGFFSGGTTVNGGRLVFDNNKANGPNYVSNAELEFNLTANDLLFNDGITLGGLQINNGTISGTGKLTKTGDKVLLLGDFGGPQTVALTGSSSVVDVQGGLLQVFYAFNGVPTNSWTGNEAGINVASGAVFDMKNGHVFADELTGSGTITKGGFDIGNNILTIGVKDGNGTFNGSLQDADPTATMTLVKQGTGTQRLKGNITYRGGTTVSGGRLILENTKTGNQSYTTNSELEFNLTTGTQQFENGTISGTGKFIKTGASSIILGNFSGPQTVALTGANSVIEVQGGMLQVFYAFNGVPTNSWTGNEAGITVASGAIFDMRNGHVFADELTGTGTITKGGFDIGNNILTIGVKDGSGTFSGTLQDADFGATLTLVKEGSGTQTLNGTSTYRGGTAVNAGTLQIGDGGTTGSLGGGAVTVAGTLIFNRSDNYGTGGGQSFSGAGTFIKNGAGDLIFNGGADHTGAQGINNLVVNDGLIRTDFWGQWNSNLNLTVNGSGKFELWNGNATLGNLSGNGTVQNTQNFGRSQTLTVAAGSFSGLISDNGGGTSIEFVKSSAGTLTLSGANTYTGTTTVSAGTLALVGGSQTSPITVSAGASLGLALGSPTTSTSSFNLTNGTIKITGTPTLATYTLISSSSGITGTPVLHAPISGYALAVDGNSLKLVQTGGSGYSTWAATNAPSQTSAQDFDGDGVANGVEYVLGGTKDTKDLGKLPQISTSGANMVVIFNRDQASIDGVTTVAIQVGTTLAAWPDSYNVPGPALAHNPGITVTKNTSPSFDTITLTIPRTPDAKKFARLNVMTN